MQVTGDASWTLEELEALDLTGQVFHTDLTQTGSLTFPEVEGNNGLERRAVPSQHSDKRAGTSATAAATTTATKPAGTELPWCTGTIHG